MRPEFSSLQKALTQLEESLGIPIRSSPETTRVCGGSFAARNAADAGLVQDVPLFSAYR